MTNVRNFRSLLPILRCPRCRSALKEDAATAELVCTLPDCSLSQKNFPHIDGQPALVDFDSSLFDEDEFRSRKGGSVIGGRNLELGRKDTLLKKLGWDTNPSAKRICGEMVKKAISGSAGRRPLVLVIGGGQAKDAVIGLYTNSGVDVVGTDVYCSPLTTLVADGHHLPFADGSFDAVWIQAVLEHVLDPQQVVDEIHRVLRKDGLVFADTPFMQMVHEGAYDFTRFSLSGHRWLFRRFQLIESGCGNGAAVMLYWAIRYFFRAMLGSKASQLASALFFWLPLLDRLGRPRNVADAAGGVYFYGSRAEQEMPPAGIIDFYEKQKKLPVHE